MVHINKMALSAVRSPALAKYNNILLKQSRAVSSIPVSKCINDDDKTTPPLQKYIDRKIKKRQYSVLTNHPYSLMRQFDDLFMFPSPVRTSRFDSLFNSPLLTSVNMRPFFDDFDRQAVNFIQLKTMKGSPGYEISEDEKSMTLKMDIPGVKLEDITVEIEDDGDVLHVYGERKNVEENSKSSLRFDKRFGIGGRFDSDNVNANLKDGVLTIVAPKIDNKKEAKKVKITEGA